MANICYSEFTFYVTEEDLELLESFNKFFKDDLGYITNYFDKLNIPPEYYEQKTESLKNDIVWCEDIKETTKDGKKIYYFIISTESAWCPYPEHFQLLIDHKWEGIKFVYYAEELDDGLFINTDKDGIFNPTYYRIYGYYCNSDDNGADGFEEYFEDKEEIAKFLNKEIKTDKFNKDMSLKEMENTAEEILASKFDTYSVSIYKFESEV